MEKIHLFVSVGSLLTGRALGACIITLDDTMEVTQENVQYKVQSLEGAPQNDKPIYFRAYQLSDPGKEPMVADKWYPREEMDAIGYKSESVEGRC